MTFGNVFLAFVFIFCMAFSALVEQNIWPMVIGMNDVYTQSSMTFQREQGGCFECALTAKTMNAESFSCHNADQMCLIHGTCRIKSYLSPGTFTNAQGWRHFCRRVHVSSGSNWQDVGPLLSRKLSIRFDVRASTDAYFGLSSGNATTFNGYWIVLGGWGNSKSCLRDGFVYASSCFYTHIGNPLIATEYVKFWVQWNLGNVIVGIGETFGDGQIMQYNFSQFYSITNVLVKSSGNTANWTIYL